MSCNECVLTTNILYSGKLSREKTITNFAVLWLFAKVFSSKFGGVTFFGVAKASNPQMLSPSIVSCYTVMHKSVFLNETTCTGWYHSLHIHSSEWGWLSSTSVLLSPSQHLVYTCQELWCQLGGTPSTLCLREGGMEGGREGGRERGRRGKNVICTPLHPSP